MTVWFVFEVFDPVVNGIVAASHNLAEHLTARGADYESTRAAAGQIQLAAAQ
ncbi:MAG TPA: hypothetical protein VJ932_02165 [Alkalispirochaeta sp.]|nr:hypothetical protein [Alkalispirochaeta sp.]